MRIDGWHIDGFGVFSDYRLDGLDPRLNVFLGPNEAGKSTLLAFVRGVLFGFPDRRSRAPQYPPLRGGRHGGRIFLADEEGRYTLDREVGRAGLVTLTLPDGSEADGQEVRRLLGGADDQLFRSIFAFSLTELQSFSSLSEEGIRDRIFSAGIAGAGRSARQVCEGLEGAMGRLLKPRSGEIRELRRQLDELSGRFREARAGALSYAAWLRQEAAAEAEVQQLSEAIAATRGLIHRCEALQAMWPSWVRREEARVQLDGLPAIDAFPEAAEPRLSELNAQIRELQEKIAHLVQRRRQIAAQHEALAVDDRLPAIAETTAALLDTLTLQRDRAERLIRLEREREAATDRLRQAIAALGPGWDEARLAAHDPSLAQREAVRGWQERLEGARRKLTIDTARRDALDTTRQEAQWRRNEVHQEIRALPPPLGPEQLAQAQDGVAQLRVARSNADSLTRDMAALGDRIAQAEREVQRLRRQMDGLRSGLAAGVAAGVALLGGAAAAWGGSEREEAVAIAGLVAAVLGVLACAYLLVQRRSTRRAWRADLAAAEASLAELQARRATLEGRDREAQRLLKQVAATLDLPSPVEPEHIDAAQQQVKEAADARARWDRLYEDLQRAEETLAKATAAFDDARSAARASQAALQAAEREWVEWKVARGVEPDLSPPGVIDVFDRIAQARDALLARDSVARDAATLAADIAQWEERARATLAQAGGLRAPLTEAIPQLAERIAEDRGRRARRAELAAQRLEHDQALARETERLETQLAARDSVLIEAEAVDEEDFRQRLAVFRQRVEARRRFEEASRDLDAQLGFGAEAEQALADLATGRLEAWRQEAEVARERLQELEAERERAVETRRDARRAREAIERSADVAALETERTALDTELAGSVRRWRTLALAKALVGATLREFERTRQPAVLARASGAFRQVTSGRYDRVVQDESGAGLRVFDAAGRAKEPQQLSRGTAEQLYLAIRLGLAEEFGRKSVPLPLVIDDVLVNFDPERAAAMADLLVDFAREHQILFFTCHPFVADMFTERLAGLQPIRLQRLDSGTPRTDRPRLLAV